MRFSAQDVLTEIFKHLMLKCVQVKISVSDYFSFPNEIMLVNSLLKE